MKLSKPLLTTTSHFAKASLVVINHSNAYIKQKVFYPQMMSFSLLNPQKQHHFEAMALCIAKSFSKYRKKGSHEGWKNYYLP